MSDRQIVVERVVHDPHEARRDLMATIARTGQYPTTLPRPTRADRANGGR
jgi:hypothetical protein